MIEIQVKTSISITIYAVSLMESIIEREATFENNYDVDVTQKQTKLSRAFMYKCQLDLISQAHWGRLSL